MKKSLENANMGETLGWALFLKIVILGFISVIIEIFKCKFEVYKR